MGTPPECGYSLQQLWRRKYPESKYVCFVWAAPLQMFITGERWQLPLCPFASTSDWEHEQQSNQHSFPTSAKGWAPFQRSPDCLSFLKPVQKDTALTLCLSAPPSCLCCSQVTEGSSSYPVLVFTLLQEFHVWEQRAALYPWYSHNPITLCKHPLLLFLTALLPETFIVIKESTATLIFDMIRKVSYTP